MNDVTDTADTTEGQDPTTVEDATAAGGGASDWAPADESTSSGLQQAPREECIVAENVVKTFGEVVALDGVSMEVSPGSYHCLLGPNGSGKSTLMRLILDLASTDSGEITRPDAVMGCGFQQPNFYPDLSARENIDVFTSMVGADDEDWNQTVVDELRLGPALDREASDLSGGYSRKLDLALSLIKKPDFLLLDEPLAALDDVSKAQLLDFLDDYRQKGNTVLVSTHYVAAFEPYLDHVTLMHDGNVLFDSPMDELDIDDDLQSHYVQAILDREDASSFEQTLVE
jgi:ABC-type multidrug transport system ATPase subunit